MSGRHAIDRGRGIGKCLQTRVGVDDWGLIRIRGG